MKQADKERLGYLWSTGPFPPVVNYIEKIIQSAEAAAREEERKPMECGHQKACWVDKTTTDPDNWMSGGIKGDAYCSACRELLRVAQAVREANDGK